jgi:hypothetical protein
LDEEIEEKPVGKQSQDSVELDLEMLFELNTANPGE